MRYWAVTWWTEAPWLKLSPSQLYARLPHVIYLDLGRRHLKPLQNEWLVKSSGFFHRQLWGYISCTACSHVLSYCNGKGKWIKSFQSRQLCCSTSQQWSLFSPLCCFPPFTYGDWWPCQNWNEKIYMAGLAFPYCIDSTVKHPSAYCLPCAVTTLLMLQHVLEENRRHFIHRFRQTYRIVTSFCQKQLKRVRRSNQRMDAHFK